MTDSPSLDSNSLDAPSVDNASVEDAAGKDSPATTRAAKLARIPPSAFVMTGMLAIAAGLGVVAYNQYEMAAYIDGPGSIDRVIASTAFDKAVTSSVTDLDVPSSVLSSDVLKSLVDVSVTDQLSRYQNSPEFQGAVSALIPISPRVERNSGKLSRIQSKLQDYELQLSSLAREVKDDAGAQKVNDMQANLLELERMIGGLSEEVHCTLALAGRGSSSFLVKEKRSTNLRGYNLIVTLGKLRDDVIDSVVFSGPNADHTQTDTRVVGNVRLGSSLEFQSGGNSYQGTFTYRQARLGPDFVGFEVTDITPPAASCITT